MKGFTKLQVDLLMDAAAPTMNHRADMDHPRCRESLQELVDRRLMHLIIIEEYSFGALAEGVITTLGRDALRVALIEPSLVKG